MVRNATPDDIPAMLHMGERFVTIAWDRVGVPFDDASCEHLLRSLMDGPEGVLLVNDACDAMIGVIVHPWHFNHNVLTATELFWWAEPGAKDTKVLREEAEALAVAMGARTFNMAAQEHLRADSLARLYRGAGYVPSERVFIKDLR